MGVLDGKVAVAGGSRGIGRAVVRRLAHDGAEIVFSYLSNDVAAKELEAAIEAAGGRAEALRVDLGGLEEVRSLLEEAERRRGGLDILVNNAGTGVVTSFADASEEDFVRVVAVNAKGTFSAMQEAARRMRKWWAHRQHLRRQHRASQPGRRHLCRNQGGRGAVRPGGRQGAGRRGITVNVVSPGATDTEMFPLVEPTGRRRTSRFGRLGQPADVADVVAFLAGPDARWLTGQHLRASGGLP